MHRVKKIRGSSDVVVPSIMRLWAKTPRNPPACSAVEIQRAFKALKLAKGLLDFNKKNRDNQKMYVVAMRALYLAAEHYAKAVGINTTEQEKQARFMANIIGDGEGEVPRYALYNDVYTILPQYQKVLDFRKTFQAQQEAMVEEDTQVCEQHAKVLKKIAAIEKEYDADADNLVHAWQVSCNHYDKQLQQLEQAFDSGQAKLAAMNPGRRCGVEHAVMARPAEYKALQKLRMHYAEALGERNRFHRLLRDHPLNALLQQRTALANEHEVLEKRFDDLQEKRIEKEEEFAPIEERALQLKAEWAVHEDTWLKQLEDRVATYLGDYEATQEISAGHALGIRR